MHTHNRVTDGHLFRALIGLAGPMFLSALLQNLQSLIDLFWVGRLGSSSVAALAISGTILMMLFPLVMGMATGTVAVVARRVGENRLDAASEAAGQSLALAAVIGLFAGFVAWAFAMDLCRLLGAAPDVAELAAAYLRISLLGAFTIFLLFIGSSIFQASGNTVIPMLTMMLANALNIVLDPLLIFGLLGLPKLGIRGAAVATVIAQAMAAALIIYLLSSGRSRIHVPFRFWRPAPAVVAAILRIGMPGCAQMLARSLMALVLMRIVAGCGTAAVAAYGIGLRFHMIVLMPAFALGNAAATMVGQNLGAGKPGRARKAGWLAAGTDAGIMGASALLMFLFAAPLVRLFDANPEVVATGAAYMRTTSWFYTFVGLAIVLGRGLQGAGDTVAPMIFTIVSLWGLQVPLAVGLSRVFDPPTQGIWWAIAAAVTVHGLLVTAWFQFGRWQRRRV